MRSIALILAVVGGTLTFAPLWSQEPPQKQLEFVRKLRNRGYVDLAMEYLGTLEKSADPKILAALPVERARLAISLARTQQGGQRTETLRRAREELTAFVEKNPDSPETPQIALEIARLAAQQGKEILAQALRHEDTPAQQEQALAAEPLFKQALQQFEVAAKKLGDTEGLQARLDQAITMMEMAEVYIDLANEDYNAKRAFKIMDATKAFNKLLEEEKGPATLLARAWLVKAYHEATQPQDALKNYKRVMDDRDQSAIPAQRLARLLYLQGAMLKAPAIEKLKPAVKMQRKQKFAQEWLKDYPSERNSPEGLAIRFELANAYAQEARILLSEAKDPKIKKIAEAVAKSNNQAKKLLAELTTGDHDYTQRANQLLLAISFQEMGADTPTAQLKDFEQCYLKAHYEKAQMRELTKKLSSGAVKGEEKRKEVDKKRQEHLQEVIRALRRALALVDAKTNLQKLDEARLLLVDAYLVAGDPYRAAVAGEALGRTEPPTKNAPMGAGRALETYASLMARDNIPDNRQRVKDLAKFILQDREKWWKGDAVTPVARYQLAMAYTKENNYPAAIAELEKLPRDYLGYIFAQGRLFYIALEGRDKAKKAQDKKLETFYLAKAREALQRMGKLPESADPITAIMYFSAKMKEGEFLYAEGVQELTSPKANLAKAAKKFEEMTIFLDKLQDELKKLPIKLPPKSLEDLQFSLGVVRKYSLLGKADADYRASLYDKLLSDKTGIGALVEEVKKRGATKGPISMKDFQVTSEILGVAMRAYVQKGKVSEAQEILKLLERLTGEEGGIVADRAPVLRALVQELSAQVRQMRKSGDTVKLKTMIDNFSVFIDDLAKQMSKKDLDLEQILFLANCYLSLDKFDKAAALYAKVPAPQCLNNKKLNDEEEKEVQEYWYVQVQLAKALRLKENLKEKKEEKDFKEAKIILHKLQTHPNGRFLLLAEKEQIFLLEDQEVWGLAVNKWAGIMRNQQVVNGMRTDATLKAMYFEAYFRFGYCLYRYSQTEKAIQSGKEAQYVRQAANHFLRLENSTTPEGWELVKDDILDLLDNERKLRDAYEELKKASK